MIFEYIATQVMESALNALQNGKDPIAAIEHSAKREFFGAALAQVDGNNAFVEAVERRASAKRKTQARKEKKGKKKGPKVIEQGGVTNAKSGVIDLEMGKDGVYS